MELQDILERLRSDESIRSIQRNTGTHKTIIREIRDLASQKGWLDPSLELPSEFELQMARDGQQEPISHPLDRFSKEIEGWREKGYSFVVIHQLINDQYSCSEATVRRYIHRKYPSTPEPVGVRTAIPGDVMEVDFGYVGNLFDPISKRNRKAWLFSGRLNYSRMTWREIVFDQRQETFFECHIRAFEFFGGVPAQVVPDNLKAAVIKASHEDPLVNKAYRSLARHYGFRINPCRPYTPEHKGGVENDIKYTKGQFMPLFREREKQRGVDEPDVVHANEALLKWSNEVAHLRKIRGVGVSPIELFDTEKVSLMNLPNSRWDSERWMELKVGRDWRIQLDNSKYTVPHNFVGQRVMVCSTMHLIRIFYDSNEITVHQRALTSHQDVVKEDHAPPHKQAYMSVTRESLHRSALEVGPETGKLIKLLIDRPEVDGLKPSRKLLSLAKEFGADRLEKACLRANKFETQSYGSVKNILQNNLDQEESVVQVEYAPVVERSKYRFSRLMVCISGLTLSFIIQGGKLWMISLS